MYRNVVASHTLQLYIQGSWIKITLCAPSFSMARTFSSTPPPLGEHGEGRLQNSFPLTKNFSQKLTQPSKGISYPVGDFCRRFTKWTLPSAYTLHSNAIPETDGTNGFFLLVADISQTGQQCFTNMFLSSYCWEF